MDYKDVLKEHIKENKKEIIFKTIENDMSSEDIKFALSFIQKLNKVWKHEITKISYSKNGDLNIKCSTGINFIKENL